MTTRYLMDFVVGEVIETSPVSLSASEIIEFVKLYDPQKFHIDPEAAKSTHYEGLIASGLQTIAVAFGQFIRMGYIRDSSLGGPGIDQVEWLAPVRPDDELNTRIKVLEVRSSKSKPDRGILRLEFTMNVANISVVKFTSTTFLLLCPRAKV